MDGYSVAARIERAHPRFVAGREPGPAVGAWPAAPLESARSMSLLPAKDSAADSPSLDEPGDLTLLGERWDAFRDRWTQLTFFLFDPDSWRS